jgi:hypothetical protein
VKPYPRRFAAVAGGAMLAAACAPPVPFAPRPAPVTGAFVTTVGTDTLQIERFARLENVITGRIVSRSPTLTLRDYTYQYRADGSIARAEVLMRPPEPQTDSLLNRWVLTFVNDTVVVETGTGDAARVQWIPERAFDLAFFGALSFAAFEYAAQRTPRTVADSAVLQLYVPPALGGVQRLVQRRVASDTVTMWAAPMGTLRVSLDELDRALRFNGIGSSLNYVVTRLPDIDIDSVALAYAARGPAGAIGALAPRDTVTTVVHGAQFVLDYGRPYVRGREIFGEVVPWGRVWRLGANQATHFRTERDVVIGGLTVPAGLYTLWVLPVEGDRWHLIVNRQSGQWGTIYDPERDLGRVPLTVRRLTEPVEQLTIRMEPRTVGGVFLIQWDTYEASVPFSPR